MLNKKIFAERVKSLRLERNASQQAVAEHLNIGKSAVSMIESSQRAVSADNLIALADFFDVSLDFLKGDKLQLYFLPYFFLFVILKKLIKREE